MCNLINIHTHTHTLGPERGRGGNGNGVGDTNESSSRDGNGDGGEIANGIEEGGGAGKKCSNPHNGCRRDVRNRGDLNVSAKKRRQEKIG